MRGEEIAEATLLNSHFGISPVNLLHIFKTPFLKNTSGWLLLKMKSAKLDYTV